MDQLSLTIPNMYADHHVTKVRQIVLQQNGVEDVIASAAFKTILVTFDGAKVSAEKITDALVKASYAPGELPVIGRGPDHTSDPAWDALAQRAVTTNQVDLQMSGEFRKY